jgi:formyl-CoA transferase
MVRVTGFGQTGPYRSRPGFGTLAEAMSGFAHITGLPDGPPTLPPFGLADGVAAQYGTFATMFALYERDAKGSGKGQVIDLSIYEPLFALLGYQATLYDQLGVVQGRTGNRSVNNAPRNTYKTSDGRWVALSASAPSIVQRVLKLTGGEAFAEDPRFQTATGRVAHVDEIDAVVGGWISQHTLEEVIREFEAWEGAIAPVNDVAQLMADPHVAARGDVIEVADPELGSLRMQNVFPFLSRTPGAVRHAGPAKGAHNEQILHEELGIPDEVLARMRGEGII